MIIVSFSATVPADVAADIKWQLWSSEDIQLRGANMYQQENEDKSPGADLWYPKLDFVDIKNLAAKRANMVTFSIPGPFNVMHPWKKNKNHVKEIDKLVRWAKEANLYVVLAIRTGPGRSEADITDEGCHPHVRSVFTEKHIQKRYIKMWEFMAGHYGKMDHVVGFDIMVEPHAAVEDCDQSESAKKRCDCFTKTWHDLGSDIVNAIREKGCDTPILVSTDHWGVPYGLSKWKPIEAKKIVQTVHLYEPYEYSHDNKNAKKIKKELEIAFDYIKKFQKCNPKIPIAIMEFGVTHDNKKSEKYLEKVLSGIDNVKANSAIWIWEVRDSTYCCKACQQFNFRNNEKLETMMVEYWHDNTTR
jgi:aryl-phospho-beta-D-glucosidase BglC (GH1 family)